MHQSTRIVLAPNNIAPSNALSLSGLKPMRPDREAAVERDIKLNKERKVLMEKMTNEQKKAFTSELYKKKEKKGKK